MTTTTTTSNNYNIVANTEYAHHAEASNYFVAYLTPYFSRSGDFLQLYQK